MDGEHALIVSFGCADCDWSDVDTLADTLHETLQDSGIGEFDGHDRAVDGSDATFYVYGTDADLLASVVLPMLRGVSFMKGARVNLRYGPPVDGVVEREFRI